MTEPFAGYWGKLPAHGDFLRGGFPEPMVARLDQWIEAQFGAASRRHGDAFEALWHAAPSWHFAMRPGVLDPHHAVTGIWMPSIDAVGRCFPFVFAILHEPKTAMFRALPPYDAAIRSAIEHTQSIDVLETAITSIERGYWPAAAPVFDVWWCTGSPDGGTLHGALPVGQAFEWLLEGASPKPDAHQPRPAHDAGGPA